MDTLNIQCGTNTHGIRLGAGLAFACGKFYVSGRCSNKITVLNKNMEICDEICAEREYSSLCFDGAECCFWACATKCGNRIYKLDMCFKEIDCICFRTCGTVTGVSYLCECDALLLAIGGRAYRLFKDGAIEEICANGNSVYGVLALSPYLATIGLCGCGQVISVFYNGEKYQQYCLERGSFIETIIFVPNCHCGEFYCLISNCGGFSRICRCELEIETPICPCYFERHECCCKPKPSENISIVRSVALVETAIAHILNAEGEKLQKIIACSCDPDKILAANKSVRETITAATHLEHVLYDKLSLNCDKIDCGCLDCHEESPCDCGGFFECEGNDF